jgi:hypothetical protein
MNISFKFDSSGKTHDYDLQIPPVCFSTLNLLADLKQTMLLGSVVSMYALGLLKTFAIVDVPTELIIATPLGLTVTGSIGVIVQVMKDCNRENYDN